VYNFLTGLHVVVCIFLMLVVLLQAGRGGGMGIAFGGSGGSQSVFGSSGGANFLTKMTAICAFIFFANSLTLAYMSSQSDSRRLQKDHQHQKDAHYDVQTSQEIVHAEVPSFTSLANDSTVSEAPPTRAPSISFLPIKLATLSGLTLPP
jgi:preprotein translocase subunit SecG